MLDKRALRKKLIAERDGIAKQRKARLEKSILDSLFNHEAYQKAISIMTYIGFGSEIDTWQIIEQAWANGKIVYVPKIVKTTERSTMIAVKINERDDLAAGTWGILEPINSEPADASEIDLIIVPGLAFNAQGYRIGYGGGYYDQFLPHVRGRTIALCFDRFLREDIPVESWDIPVEIIITEKRVLPTKR
ncbi:MAG: 5-formyltetrahydrofolate cyclo-ligase [Firmicutes bacterium]|nr:5-formyltetrahydrofolate cyclo-ligase [Bacillota bacterium]